MRLYLLLLSLIFLNPASSQSMFKTGQVFHYKGTLKIQKAEDTAYRNKKIFDYKIKVDTVITCDTNSSLIIFSKSFEDVLGLQKAQKDILLFHRGKTYSVRTKQMSLLLKKLQENLPMIIDMLKDTVDMNTFYNLEKRPPFFFVPFINTDKAILDDCPEIRNGHTTFMCSLGTSKEIFPFNKVNAPVFRYRSISGASKVTEDYFLSKNIGFMGIDASYFIMGDEYDLKLKLYKITY